MERRVIDSVDLGMAIDFAPLGRSSTSSIVAHQVGAVAPMRSTPASGSILGTFSSMVSRAFLAWAVASRV